MWLTTCYTIPMIGLLLALAATFFTETQDSIGKRTVEDGRQSIYTMGFLSLFWGFLFFLGIIIFIRKEFLFSLASLPTFIPRAILEVALAHVSMLAIIRSDRSTFGLIRIGTIPLLLAVDMTLGYSVSGFALLGIGLLVAALLFVFWSRAIGKAGIDYVLFTAVAAAATLSLFKWNITQYNALEAEQIVIIGILAAYFFLMSRVVAKENPLAFLLKPLFLFQSLSAGLGEVLMSFAYLFGAASVITAAKRALSVLFAILSGHIYFKEKRLAVKLALFLFLAVGLLLLTR